MRYPDLASRALGGSVMWANDESFAEKENLIAAHEPTFDPALFGHKGKVYDGWETRRRRDEGYDSVIVRLGVPGQITAIDVNTAWFKGNYPPECSIDIANVTDYIPAEKITGWEEVVSRSSLKGNTHNEFELEMVPATHVRLNIYPDGGVARLRVFGKATPDPRFLTGTIDLAAAENGGLITDCSNLFYSAPEHMIGLGRASSMADGWENARRRVPGNEHVTVRLAGKGRVDYVEVDTSYFLFNCPRACELEGKTSDGNWIELCSSDLVPDTRHRFRVDSEEEVTDVRLKVFPDGGVSRLRVFGTLSEVPSA